MEGAEKSTKCILRIETHVPNINLYRLKWGRGTDETDEILYRYSVLSKNVNMSHDL